MCENNMKKIRKIIVAVDFPEPHIMETLTISNGIMQERITRINLAVDPPDILIEPHLGELKL
ncbi:MAG: hypothetical protein WBC36_12195 [Desulfobacterales bacterium]